MPCSLSKNAVKRAINKARKAAKLASAKAAAERYVEEHNLSRQVVERASEKKAPGKAGRAKAFALHGLIQGHSHATHRAAGGVAVAGSVKPEHAAVVAALEALETAERLRSRPHLGERRAVVVDPHGTMEAAGDSSTSTGSTSTSTSTGTGTSTGTSTSTGSTSSTSNDGGGGEGDAPQQGVECCSLRGNGLFACSASSIRSFAAVVSLDLSRNFLSSFGPLGLQALVCLRHLNLDRNWLEELPDFSGNAALVSVRAQHNMLRGCVGALRVASLAGLRHFASLDVRFNKLCSSQQLLDEATEGLGGGCDRYAVKMTVTV